MSVLVWRRLVRRGKLDAMTIFELKSANDQISGVEEGRKRKREMNS